MPDKPAAQPEQPVADRAELVRDAMARNLPTGPTPAFLVSVMEVDRALHQVIARAESVRAQSLAGGKTLANGKAQAGESAVAVAPPPASAPDPAPKSDTPRPESTN